MDTLPAKTAPKREDGDVDDLSLLERMRKNDRSAFRHLYERHARPVFLYSFAIVHDQGVTEEAAQETWLTFWSKRSGISLVGTSVLPWLLVTARHKSLNQMSRLRRREPEVHLDDTLDLPAANDNSVSVLATDVLLHIDSLIDDMPAVDREIFNMCIRDGRSYAHAAAALQIEHGAVRNRLSRVRLSLRSALTSNGDHDGN